MERFLREVQTRAQLEFRVEPVATVAPAETNAGTLTVGFRAQKQEGKFFVAAAPPVGRVSVRQLETLAFLAKSYGQDQLRLTIRQRVLLQGISEDKVPTVKRHLIAAGLDFDPGNACVGLVACAGTAGCLRAYTDTKKHALAIGVMLQREVPLERPISIHVVGCERSCVHSNGAELELKGRAILDPERGQVAEGYEVRIVRSSGDAVILPGIGSKALPALVLNLVRFFKQRRTNREEFARFYERLSDNEIRNVAQTGKLLGR
jgi:ferredoxin-nitrite reductase